jgi:cysteinyl-tRNA synthetase
VDKSASQISKIQKRVEKKLSVLALTLDPTANTVSSVSVAYSRFYGFEGNPQFLEDWTKHGPPFISSAAMTVITDRIGIRTLNRIIERRLNARAKKNWKESDRIRDELKLKGIELRDNKDGTSIWRVMS